MLRLSIDPSLQVYTSADGASWPAQPTATGTFEDTAELKTFVLPGGAKTARGFRLRALTEAGGRGPWSSGAELNVLGTYVAGGGGGGGGGGGTLSRRGWTATADSTQPGELPAQAVLDDSVDTFWHSKYTGTADPLPHTLTITLGGGRYSIGGLVYQPRGDGSPNGRCGNYQVCTPCAVCHRQRG